MYENKNMREIIFSIHLKKLPEGHYLATSQDLPGLVAEGRTISETLETARNVSRKLMESYREHGRKLPATIKSKIVKSIDMLLAVEGIEI